MRTIIRRLRDLGWSSRAMGWMALIVSFVLAIGVTGGTGFVLWRKNNLPVSRTVTVADVFENGGVRFQVDRFEVIKELPNLEEEGEPPLAGPEGSSMVVLVMTVQPVSPDADMEYALCDPVLHNADRVEWRRDDFLAGRTEIPAHLSCSLPKSYEEDAEPWPREKPFQTSATFVVPDTMLDGIHIDLRVTRDASEPFADRYDLVRIVPAS